MIVPTSLVTVDNEGEKRGASTCKMGATVDEQIATLSRFERLEIFHWITMDGGQPTKGLYCSEKNGTYGSLQANFR